MAILCPVANDSVKVIVQGGGPQGTICAHGRLSVKVHGQITVFVKVYPGFSPAISTTPEGVQVNPTGQTWFAANVPVPDSSPNQPGAELTVVEWEVAGSGAPFRESQPFFGRQGAGTDCCAGSGLQLQEQQQQVPYVQAVAVSLAPLLWNLLAAGFHDGTAPFNGNWLLDLRHIHGGYCSWDNGGDGIETPRIELRCESPLATTWQLTFQHGANPVVQYTCAAVEWNSLTANVLHRHPRNGLAAGTMPEQLTVTPG